MKYLILFLLLSVMAFTQSFDQKAQLLKGLTETKFNASALEKMRDAEIAALGNLVKDEFETQAEFEKRKSEAAEKINSVKSSYAQRIAEAKKIFDRRKADIEAEFDLLLSSSLADVSSGLVVGTYDPENNTFPVTVSLSGQNVTVKVPRESARGFKEQAASLTAKGKKQMNRNLVWEYFNWSVVTNNGESYALGEQRGISAQVAQLQSAPPPSLAVSVAFTDDSGNDALDAEEKGKLGVTITNSGQGTSLGLEAKITSENSAGVAFAPSLFIGEVQPGKSRTVYTELTAGDKIQDGTASFLFTFTEARGFPPDPVKISVQTRALLPPQFVIADIGVIEPSGNGTIENEEVVEITARIRNTGRGTAKNVKGSFDLGVNIFATPDFPRSFEIGELKPGAYYDAKIKIYTNRIAKDIPLYISITEPSGRFDLKRRLLDQSKLALNVRVQKLQEITVAGKEDEQTQFDQPEGLSVDIWQDIPVTKTKNSSAVAVIIGIRDYASRDIPRVEYAKRDAALMREYLIKVLGYDPKNILPQNPEELMTVGNMKSLLRQKLPSYVKPDGSSDIFIYYTGHGAPSTTSQQPFFVPYDCDPNFVSVDNAYPMNDFYADIAKIAAKKKTVVIDACFSGQAGDGSAIIKNASPVLFKVDNPLLTDANTLLFQSSEASQVSNWYPEKKHGMFTYFFLKGLKGEADMNKDGSIAAGELEEYINDENQHLPYISRREFQRPQRAILSGSRETVVR